MKVTYSRQAQRDRVRHIDYVEQFSFAAADRLDGRLQEGINLLSRFPHLGKAGRTAGVRELRIYGTPLLVLYRIDSKQILILRILHVAQDWPGRF